MPTLIIPPSISLSLQAQNLPFLQNNPSHLNRLPLLNSFRAHLLDGTGPDLSGSSVYRFAFLFIFCLFHVVDYAGYPIRQLCNARSYRIV